MPEGRRPSLWTRLVGAARIAVDRAADGVEALADGLRSLGRGRDPAPPMDARLTGVDPAIAAYVSARDPEWFSLEVPEDVETDAGGRGFMAGPPEPCAAGADRRRSGPEDPPRVFFPAPPRKAGAGDSQTEQGTVEPTVTTGGSGASAVPPGNARERAVSGDAEPRVAFPRPVGEPHGRASAPKAAPRSAAVPGDQVPEASPPSRKSVPAPARSEAARDETTNSDARAPRVAAPLPEVPEPTASPIRRSPAPPSTTAGRASAPRWERDRGSAPRSGIDERGRAPRTTTARSSERPRPAAATTSAARTPEGAAATSDPRHLTHPAPTPPEAMPRGIRPSPAPMPSLSDRPSSSAVPARTSPWPELPPRREDEPRDESAGALAWAAASRTDVLVDEQRSR